MKAYLLIALMLCAPLATPEGLRAEELPPSVKECRSARAAAWEAMRLARFAPEKHSFDLGEFLRVAEACWTASETASTDRAAALLAAESYVCRAIYERFEGYERGQLHEETEKRELRRGIETVSRLDGDSSPALLELLDRLSLLEWEDEPKEAVRLLERRVEIARLAYGADDSRYADILREAAERYEPSYNGGDVLSRGADDPEIAEDYYRKALKVLVSDPAAEKNGSFLKTLTQLRWLYRSEGREQDEERIEGLIEEIRLEAQLDAELSEPPGGEATTSNG